MGAKHPQLEAYGLLRLALRKLNEVLIESLGVSKLAWRARIWKRFDIVNKLRVPVQNLFLLLTLF